MNEEYKINVKRCINNIYYLAKSKNIRIGDLEKELNVSTGYFSRLLKNEKLVPSTDVLYYISKKFDVSIDLLLNFDLNYISGEIKVVVSFLNKLIKMTKDNDLNWDSDNKVNLEFNIDNGFINPLYVKKEITQNDIVNKESDLYEYNNIFINNEEIDGEFLYAKLEDYNATLYLVKTKSRPLNTFNKSNDKALELFIYKDNKLKGICFTNYKQNIIYEFLLRDLYRIASLFSYFSKIDNDTLDFISDFSNKDKQISKNKENQ